MASKNILFLNKKVHQCSHPWPLGIFLAKILGRLIKALSQNPIQILWQCFHEQAKYFGQKNALVRPLEVKGANADGLYHWETKYPWRPLEAKSDFATMFLWTGQVVLPEKCPGQASKGQRSKRQWTFSLRNKIFLEANRGKIRFFNNVFMNWPSSLARKMPWSGL